MLKEKVHGPYELSVTEKRHPFIQTYHGIDKTEITKIRFDKKKYFR